MGISGLTKAGCTYSVPGSEVVIVSPPDDLCFYKALAHLAYEEPHVEPYACQAALSVA